MRLKYRRDFMKLSSHVRVAQAFGIIFLLTSFLKAEEESPITRLFDTRVASVEAWTESAVTKRAGWLTVPEDNVSHQFAGDAVLVNDKVVVVLRKQGHGPEIYAQTAAGLKQRAALECLGNSASLSQPLDEFKIQENSASSVMLSVHLPHRANSTISYRLTTGEGLLEIRPNEWSEPLLMNSQARYVVVPDYFGDDMVYDPQIFRGFLPAENFCLHLIEGCDSIVMAVWASAAQDVSLSGTSSAKPGLLCRTQVSCQQGKSIWLAFMESAGIWKSSKEVVQTKTPFPAKWRSSLVRSNSVADSWDFDKGPALEQKLGPHLGPWLLYPLDRSQTTPLTATCPTDVMRNTLGVGPCQYILAVECMSAQGNPTPNSVMEWIEKQFEQNKQRKAADNIKERLTLMTEHVFEAHARIRLYRDFSSQARKTIAKEEASSRRFILDDLDRFVMAGLAPAASPQQAQQLTTKVFELISQENAFTACRGIGEKLRNIGETQDSTLARCRMAVRRLRQEIRTTPPQNRTAPEKELLQLAEACLYKKL